jgi:hypothetical protein
MTIHGLSHALEMTPGERVQLGGSQEFSNDFIIEKQDEWIVVSW